MTYRELYEEAFWDLQVGDITPEEFEERVKPLNQEPTSAIEELEKIKEEVANLCFIMYSNDGKNMVDITKDEIVYRINKHISELKGEQK